MSRSICILWRYILIGFVLAVFSNPAGAQPQPMLGAGHPVDWVFVYKFNAKSFPGCGDAEVSCPFGGTPQTYAAGAGQQYVYASNETPSLRKGQGCVGDSAVDPVGATFGAIYEGRSHYVVWNDQFHHDPPIEGCGASCGAPWGHSKGVLAWDDDGNGVVMQVSTPSWPASGSARAPRRDDGNSLGCIADDNVMAAQHFFALRLNAADVAIVARALANASVVTDPDDPQIVANGGPREIARIVATLGGKSRSETAQVYTLSTGVTLISKPSRLTVPPWHLVSAQLDGVSLRAATWWTRPAIPDTEAGQAIACWVPGLGQPGAVVNALAGHWGVTAFSLAGGLGRDRNHAKIAASTSGTRPYAIFGDLNQQGTLGGGDANCKSSQNGRGGLFFAVENQELHDAVLDLISPATMISRD